MSLRSLLNEPLTLVTPADASTGFDYGAAAARTVTVGRFEQTLTVEESQGWPATSPDSAVTERLLFLAPVEVVGVFTRVVRGGAVFEVVGEPNVVYGARGPHHLEVRLRGVAGEGALPSALYPSSGLFPSVALYPWGGG